MEFEYTTSNPWHGRGPRNLPKQPAEVCVGDVPSAHPVAAARKAADYTDRHVPWVVPPCKGSGGKHEGVPDRDHELADHFQESPDWYDDDYASTIDPGSDSEPLSDSDDEDGPHSVGDVPGTVGMSSSRGVQESTGRHVPCAAVRSPRQSNRNNPAAAKKASDQKSRKSMTFKHLVHEF